MRTARLKAPEHFPVAYYHCMSRIVNRDYRLGDEEKEQFVKYMRQYEDFGDLQVVTFCIMSNHFHILVEVPRRPDRLPTDEELLTRLKRVYKRTGEIAQRLQSLRASGADEAAEAFRERFFRRMWDVSWYMKTLKQRFTQWYNRKHGRKGTLWEERFRSVLVEGAGEALVTMAAYIDLNPVRAGLVEDPKDYRWCGYAGAVARNRQCLGGLAIALEARANVHGGFDRHGKSVSQTETIPTNRMSTAECLSQYRMLLFGRGDERGCGKNGRPIRRGFNRDVITAVLAAEGKLSLVDALHCRVRYFVDGAVLGSRQFVNGIFKAERHRFGATRTSGARPIRHVADCDLTTMRDLRLDPVG